MKYIFFALVFVILLALSACNAISTHDQPCDKPSYDLTQPVADVGIPSNGPPTSYNTDATDKCSTQYIPIPPTPSPPPILINVFEGDEINIAIATDSLLSAFSLVHELDYEEVKTPSSSLWSRPRSYNLIIWTTAPVTDFAILLYGYEHISRGDIYLDTIRVPIDSFGMVPNMQSGEAFVANNIWAWHHDRGMPGVTFVDEGGTQRYFSIHYRAGISANQFSLEEFQNRTRELPEDWRPPWIIPMARQNAPVTAPPSPERIAVLLEASGISQYGWQAAADFLGGMISIFTGITEAETDRDNDWQETGRFILGHDLSRSRLITTHEVPEIYHVLSPRGVRGVYDRYGNRIYDAPWLDAFYAGGINVYFYASHFRLFDFDNTGIPDIFIFFSYLFCGIDTAPFGSYSVFRYVNGEYRALEQQFQDSDSWPRGSSWAITPWHYFFIDETGRMIVMLSDDVAHGSFTGYELVTITDDHLAVYPLVVMGYDDDWAAWEVHMYELNSPTIFGTDIRLTPLYSFDELAIELSVYLRYHRQ